MKKKAAGSREGLSGLVKLIYNPIALCFHPHKSTHNRTSPLATEIQKMGYCRDLPHRVRLIPHRLRGGALLNKLKLKGQAAFGAFPVQGLTGAGLPTALHEKSPAQSAELQFVCGERGNHPFVAPFRILMQEAPTNGWTGDFAVFDISSNLSQNHLFQCYLLIPVHLL